MKRSHSLLPMLGVLALASLPKAYAESNPRLLTEYEPPLLADPSYLEADEPVATFRGQCNPDLVVSTQIFVHDSVIGGRSWDGDSQQKVTNTINSEMQRVNQAYCDPSFGTLKVQFTHSVTFITNNDLSVAGYNLGDVLDRFGGYWRSGAKNNGSDLGLIYVINPDGGVGGISPLGADVANRNNNGGPALNWGWSNKGDVIAHEVGHFFGADHDGSGDSANCPAKGDIMGGGARLTWSTCARDSIQKWLNSDRSFYFRKTRDWLKQLAQVGPLGGNGGEPFMTGCPKGSHVTQMQPEVQSIGSYISIVSFKYACSNGSSNLSGGDAAITLKADSRFRVLAGSWLTGLDIDGRLFGNKDQDRGSISCPAGQRVGGFFGRRGAAIDNFGLLCTSAANNPGPNPGARVEVGPVGGAGTADRFQLLCASGQAATDVITTMGDVAGYRSLVNIGLRCSDGQQQNARSGVNGEFPVASPASGSVTVFFGAWINGVRVGDALQGSSDYPNQTLRCESGKKLVGVFGTYGAAIDNLGLYCQ